MNQLIELINLLQQSPLIAMIVVAFLGLCVGSFLNVVIHRIPLMMEQQWKNECQYLLHPEQNFEPAPNITLSFPPSRCPKCQHKIHWYENIPVVSWLVLRGKCSGCQNPISFRYPFVEIITAILSVLVVVRFGITWQSASALLLTWYLVALTGIDFDKQLLPDRMTLPLAGMGLFVNAFGLFVSSTQAIFGYVVGFLCLWIVYKLFLMITGKHGMGYGDFKLLSALGAWLGPALLPFIIFVSALLGSIIGIILMKKSGESKPFAFGPYIAIAGMIALLYGEPILRWYLGE